MGTSSHEGTHVTFRHLPAVIGLIAAAAISTIAAAGSMAPFTEEAVARGINYTPVYNGMFGNDSPFGGAAAFVDLDDDGDPDLVAIGASSGVIGIYENDGTGNFIDRSATSGAPVMSNPGGVCAADYDRDGDLDVFISGWSQANRLLRNDGNFTFTDVGLAAGVRAISTRAAASCWGDYNNDGWIDLYVCNYVTTNSLYRNNGDGTFTDVAVSLGIVPGFPLTLQASFVDIDKDGDSDLYLATDKSDDCMVNPHKRNYLYRNDGGTFTEIAVAANAIACAHAMSIAVADCDGNRYLDFYVTNIELGNKLLCNQGNNTFLEEQSTAGVESFAFAWGADFSDFDNDGLVDLYVCNRDTNNRLYHNPGSWPYTDVAASMGVGDAGKSYGIIAADVDLDGDIDYLLHNNLDPLRLFINHEGENRNWAMFDVLGTGPNRYAIGARLELRTGTNWQMREVIAGHNYKTQNHLVQHFGLNTASTIDELQVTWPGGGVTRTLTGYDTNQRWTIYPPDKLGDADGDGQTLINDFITFAGCFTGPVVGAVSPGCEMMDFDGDSDVDMDDYDDFLLTFDGPLEDCDASGTPDITEIINGTSVDANANGVPDNCEYDVADLDQDGEVNLFDLLDLLDLWGACDAPCPPICPGDISSSKPGTPDCTVNLFDLLLLLDHWGS